ncbi:Type 2A phosphatase-associated protein 42 [Spathaspora sp. JA1]|nr:Type 2A phosphatase-associated protein 42 [Spathaspora sp. JA1]
MEQLTVGERYRKAIGTYNKLTASPPVRQSSLLPLIQEFQLISKLINQLGLFSENEKLIELNTSYITFLNVQFYLGNLHALVMEDRISSLTLSNQELFQFLNNLNNYEILNNDQQDKLKQQQSGDGVNIEVRTNREEKIANYKAEKQLSSKIEILYQYYDGEDEFEQFEEEIVRQVFTDQLKLHTIKAFDLLVSNSNELNVIKSKPTTAPAPTKPSNDHREPTRENDYGFTTKLETLPNSAREISQLISKSGKILQPFTITSEKQRLKDKVFGTGQVLPSMTVEEYLDYELSHGKLMKDEVKDKTQDIDYESDEDEEAQLEKRRWDDWKDENPKGAGNMGGNIG